MITVIWSRLAASSYWRDIFWQASGNTIGQIIGVLGMPLLTRLYSPHDFAVQNLFLQVVMFSVGFMTWRYEYFIQLPKEDGDAESLLCWVLVHGLVVLIFATFLCWLARERLAYWLGDLDLKPWLVWAPLSALLICYSVAMLHVVQRKGNFKKSGLSELVGKSAYIGSGVLGYGLGGPIGLIAAPAASAVAKMGCLLDLGKMNHSLLKKLFSSDKKSYTQGMKRQAVIYRRLANSMVFSHILSTVTASLPPVFIAHVYGGSVLGQFALVASTIYLPAGLVGIAIGQVYYQRAAEKWANGQSFDDVWRVTVRKLFIFGLPLYTSLYMLAPWGYPLIFGKGWNDSGFYASVMAIAAFFSFASSPLDRTSLIVGGWWYLPIWHCLRAITTVLVVFLAEEFKLNFNEFLCFLVVQMSAMYLIDFIMEWHFASIKPRIAR